MNDPPTSSYIYSLLRVIMKVELVIMHLAHGRCFKTLVDQVPNLWNSEESLKKEQINWRRSLTKWLCGVNKTKGTHACKRTLKAYQLFNLKAVLKLPNLFNQLTISRTTFISYASMDSHTYKRIDIWMNDRQQKKQIGCRFNLIYLSGYKKETTYHDI